MNCALHSLFNYYCFSYIYQSHLLTTNRAFVYFCTVKFPNIKETTLSSSKYVIQILLVFN